MDSLSEHDGSHAGSRGRRTVSGEEALPSLPGCGPASRPLRLSHRSSASWAGPVLPHLSGPGWGLRICISEFPGAAAAAAENHGATGKLAEDT